MTEHITTIETTWLSISEFTDVAGLQKTEVLQLVEIGILQPTGTSPHDWSFDSHAMILARRFRRIREDLELDLDLHALALGFRLLERITELEVALKRSEVAHLLDRS